MSRPSLGALLCSLPSEVVALLRATARVARCRWPWLAVALLVVSAVAFQLFPHDAGLLAWLTDDRSGEQRRWARFFSFWGDYLPGTVLWCVCLWLAGWWRCRSDWRRAALAALLAASLAGCMTLTLRTMLGRPRPVAKVNDGFYGLLWDASYHGFPSGHSTTSVATATTLLLVAPPWVSLPVTVGAGGVLWSRMLLRQHHPADVWAGACLGFLWGILFAAGTRSLADKSPRD